MGTDNEEEAPEAIGWTIARIFAWAFILFWLFGPLMFYFIGYTNGWPSKDLLGALLWPVFWAGGYFVMKRIKEWEWRQQYEAGWRTCPTCNGFGQINVETKAAKVRDE